MSEGRTLTTNRNFANEYDSDSCTADCEISDDDEANEETSNVNEPTDYAAEINEISPLSVETLFLVCGKQINIENMNMYIVFN